ncbi:MAG: metal-dependent hydrolase [Zetaproteobacteria bacterium CG12_big_fil_rev_8_21_14_0_65_55_1124]|nr:MAG: metal-dependent hydrolase [Zetaproteobacteria bacterium CG1_02_55_237]PIS18516.1 MAG: metal-dependent hydrolase [Zetaproteobacteria bacterium CG08_land_8_20_14_0_20_55_17]PIW43050.1 MAG: metal-dependent hydrolase [Zetaproteobacteria bacterium CG12_big_fil_rev_8_21_14_0_65_55_1124]PIY52583.1 MAG: metal-dependent hydrolase [Zetaproteobacteria bacterium CG_4_10_14_0_8_um_filter_55_43]PIZ38428.1 MAG: metal-dependent hydrolase [Zetaproteobacteria bacterium CG_4_10_14_0_2_um_filter_55_20]PJB
MRPKPPTNYLAGYPAELTEKIQQMIEQNRLGDWLLQKYPHSHTVRSDKALYDYVIKLKDIHLRKAGPLNKVAFDSTLHLTRNALGMHTSKSRVHGAKLKASREIHVATVFKDMPPEFLRMIVVHELAHMKESEHDKSFYKLCCNMEPDYHQLEFEVRAYLTWLESGGEPLWSPNQPPPLG